jgi:hypothetical protein
MNKQETSVKQVGSRALLGLFFDSEDGGKMFLQNVFDFQQTTRHYIPENKTLHNHYNENHISYM